MSQLIYKKNQTHRAMAMDITHNLIILVAHAFSVYSFHRPRRQRAEYILPSTSFILLQQAKSVIQRYSGEMLCSSVPHTLTLPASHTLKRARLLRKTQLPSYGPSTSNIPNPVMSMENGMCDIITELPHTYTQTHKAISKLTVSTCFF